MDKRTRNLLILVLVLIMCCFGGSIVKPFRTGVDTNPIVDLLERFASRGTTVPDTDVTTAPGSCRTGPDRFRVVSSCTLTVAAGKGLRRLILSSDRAMAVTARVPRKDYTATKDISAGTPVAVAVDEQQSAVQLTCPALQVCIVTRQDGD